jgi:SAM-dependent methyltransferase
MKGNLSRSLSTVHGWLRLKTAWIFHEAARNLPTTPSKTSVVEIGCWQGRTTIALALGLKARGGGKVYAIDPHTGSEQTVFVCGHLNTREPFLRNIRRARVGDYVDPMMMTSHAARRRFSANSVHLLVLDASREYRAVLEYIDDWSTALAGGARVFFRDPELIYAALRRRALKLGSPFRNPVMIGDSAGSVLRLEFLPAAPWGSSDSIALRRICATIRYVRKWLT